VRTSVKLHHELKSQKVFFLLPYRIYGEIKLCKLLVSVRQLQSHPKKPSVDDSLLVNYTDLPKFCFHFGFDKKRFYLNCSQVIVAVAGEIT